MSSLTDTKGQRKFTLTRVDHTGITVSSLQDSLRFWVDVLGFRHLYTWDFENDAFIVRASDRSDATSDVQTRIELSVVGSEEAELRRIFDRLSDDGTVKMPLEKTFSPLQ